MKRLYEVCFLLICLICLSFASYNISIDSADCIIYSPIFDLHSVSILSYFLYDELFRIGDFDGDGLKDIALMQTFITDPVGPTLDNLFIIWGDSPYPDSININDYPTIYKDLSNDLYMKEIQIVDLNSDSKDDMLIGLYSFMTWDYSKLCAVFGKERSSWPISERINDHVNIITTPDTICVEDFSKFIVCNIDDSPGYEIISLIESNPLFTRLFHLCNGLGWITIYDLNDFPVGGVAFGGTLYFSNTYYGRTAFPDREHIDPSKVLEKLSYVGDLNGDGMCEFSVSNSGNFPSRGPGMGLGLVSYDTTGWLNIFWGRPRRLWRNLLSDPIISPGRDTFLTVIHFRGNPVAFGGDLDGDGISDLIISDFRTIPDYPEWLTGPWTDTSKIYILFGSPSMDSLRGRLCDISRLGATVIKSKYPNDYTGILCAIGDYNGDGCGDLAVTSSNVADSGVIYVLLGNKTHDYPEFIQDAQIKINHNNIINYGDSALDSFFIINGIQFADMNNDGLDDIICINLYSREFYYSISPLASTGELLKIGYIFFNLRPAPSLFHPDTNIIDNPHDSICIKLSFKQPLALHTLLLTVSGDTFTIDSPQVRFSPAESLLCFIPDTEWDTSTIIPFCIERLEDTIGTAMRERWCVRFNDSTWNVYQPPKPRTLSLTCYPNPFNAEVRIRLRMPDAGDIKINIYDISGKLIDCIQKSKLTAGWHELVWRPGVSVPSGVYLLRVSAGGEAVVRRVVLVR